MNSESRYIYQEPTETQGLGRVPTRLTMLRPVLDEPMPRSRGREIRPRPIPSPKPVLFPRPVIDKNPVRPPKLIVKATNKASKPKPRKKAALSKSQTPPKITNKRAAENNQDILTGSFSIGGVQVKKTHAAMATGVIAGGLLLWKILF